MAKGHKFLVTFPQSDAEDVDGFDVVERNDTQDKKPVVILFGWGGCLDKHLAKYSEIYEKRFITIRHTFPTDALFFRFNLLVPIAQKALDVIFENQLEQHPIILHIFSNAGSIVYSIVSEFVHSAAKYKALDIKGCIIDSAPGKRRVFQATRAFMAILRLNIVLKYLAGFCVALCLLVSYIFSRLLGKSSSFGYPFYLYDNMCEDKAKWPQLFIYSKKDALILHEDVKEVIEHRKQKGCDVTEVCFDDSAHVSHLRAHREVYTQKCLDFISYCLKSQVVQL